MDRNGWRKAILEQLADDEDVDVDALHSEADGEEDLALAMEAVEGLVREGLAWEDHGVLKPRVGREAEIADALHHLS